MFYFTTIKMRSLTTLTTLFKFTTINPRDCTTVTTLFLSIRHFSSHQEFQCFHKICMCTFYHHKRSNAFHYYYFFLEFIISLVQYYLVSLLVFQLLNMTKYVFLALLGRSLGLQPSSYLVF